MSHIPASLRQQIIERASNICEYCHLSQLGQAATFHIDHVLPVAAGGETNLDNLALACVSCSLHKAARLTAVDPDSVEEIPIFNPRELKWADHFVWDGVQLVGKTAVGRATITALKINRPIILEIRKEEVLRGRHPV